ncbi:MAG: hypothetical protein JRM74_01580 [Nitrososphaerota archaeon]|jgi:hypothetical protein|nr:hypothetical protein [Nitrososphaerota archaeon]MDG6953039.1 hypothetical protein [Nitrososphaerota archaeon]MDG6959322.1 hypothetical protein [Nitrososphaerota archaeon]MDG6969171.1 hypothetical protein [Nitrososphaerota archaeon]MDG6971949.1 hypothetical protein [Nitrososphaerota archaeon]
MEFGGPSLSAPDWNPPVGNPAENAALWKVVLRAFGFTNDPFSAEYVLTRPGLLSAQTRLSLSRLAKRVRSGTDVLLVGPDGSGKTLLLSLLAKGLNQTGKSEKVGSSGAVCSGWQLEHNWAKKPRRASLAGSSERNQLKQHGPLIVDDCDRVVGQIMEGRSHPTHPRSVLPKYVLSVSYITYRGLLRMRSVPEGFVVQLLPRFERREIELMLRLSVESCAMDGDPYEPDAYQAISERAMGLPGLAADLAGACLWIGGWAGVTRISKALVAMVAERLSYDDANKLLTGRLELQGNEARVAHEVLRRCYTDGEMRKSDIVKGLRNLARSTAYSGLANLVEEHLLYAVQRGYRVCYGIPKPVRAALQTVEARRTAGAETRHLEDHDDAAGRLGQAPSIRGPELEAHLLRRQMAAPSLNRADLFRAPQ